MLEFKVFGSFHASSRRPTFETPTKSKSKFEILSGYRGRTPLSVVVNRCLTGRPSGGIQAWKESCRTVSAGQNPDAKIVLWVTWSAVQKENRWKSFCFLSNCGEIAK